MEHLVQGACLQGGEVPRLVRRLGDYVDGGEEGQQERRRKCSQDWWKLTCWKFKTRPKDSRIVLLLMTKCFNWNFRFEKKKLEAASH